VPESPAHGRHPRVANTSARFRRPRFIQRISELLVVPAAPLPQRRQVICDWLRLHRWSASLGDDRGRGRQEPPQAGYRVKVVHRDSPSTLYLIAGRWMDGHMRETQTPYSPAESQVNVHARHAYATAPGVLRPATRGAHAPANPSDRYASRIGGKLFPLCVDGFVGCSTPSVYCSSGRSWIAF